MRVDGRESNALRNIEVTPDYLMHPEGSVLIASGNTKVICSASVETKVPPFMRGEGAAGFLQNTRCYHEQQTPEISVNLQKVKLLAEQWKFSV